MPWRRLVLAVLVIYVGLDLCLPAMPGAFVFDAGDSVDGIDVARGRPSARPVALSAPPGWTLRPRLRRERAPVWRGAVEPPTHRPIVHRPRAGGESPPRIEDPH